MKSIRPIEHKDLAAIKEFTDRAIGENYYSRKELEDLWRRSQCGDSQCSFVLEIDNSIQGIRFTFPPGLWSQGKGKGLSPELWPKPLKKTAYFQSLFIAPEWTGQGVGKELSRKSIEVLKELGAEGIVCHSWKESPNDSSGRYFRSLGFQTIKIHPEYWIDVDYLCIKCRSKPCLCTAEEMYLELK